MNVIKSFIKATLFFAVVVAIGIFVFTNYEWIFAKKVKGVVVDVQRVTAPTIISGRPTEAQLYSYSVLIQGDDGKLYSSSSEDRQWQVVKKGYCVDALLYRYPPWALDRANAFFNARVEQIRVCPGQTSLPDGAAPTVEPTVPVAPTVPTHQ